MSYSTQDDLVPSVISGRIMIQLTDDTGSGEIDGDVVTARIADADAVIDSYCRERYKVPLQPTPVLKDISTAITAYKLYGRRASAIPEVVKDNYNEALKMLRDISAGKASLDQPIAPNVDQAASGGVVKSSRRQIFGDRNLSGFSS